MIHYICSPSLMNNPPFFQLGYDMRFWQKVSSLLLVKEESVSWIQNPKGRFFAGCSSRLRRRLIVLRYASALNNFRQIYDQGDSRPQRQIRCVLSPQYHPGIELDETRIALLAFCRIRTCQHIIETLPGEMNVSLDILTPAQILELPPSGSKAFLGNTGEVPALHNEENILNENFCSNDVHHKNKTPSVKKFSFLMQGEIDFAHLQNSQLYIMRILAKI